MKTLRSDSSYKPLYITDVSRETSEVSSSTSRDSSTSRETANSDAEISRPHEICSSAIERQICLADPERMLIGLGSAYNSNMLLIIEYIKGTKVGGIGKEADGSYIPRGKPRANSNGCEGPDSVCKEKIASSETEKHLLNAVKNYWLYPGRAHDAIAVKLVKSGTIISRMKTIEHQQGN
nr:4235_t:CDS:2 [Entrophospora candida]